MKNLRTKMIVAVLASTTAFAAVAMAENAAPTEPPLGEYKKVSNLVPLPDFIPGLGSLYVDPASLPVGPFAAYDRSKKLVSTIYMIPIEDIKNQAKFSNLAVSGSTAHSVDMYYNAGHPGVETPHYHVTIWHVDPKTVELK